MQFLSLYLPVRLQAWSFHIWVRNYLFLKNLVTLQEAHSALYYQQLPIARYRVRFMLTIILSN